MATKYYLLKELAPVDDPNRYWLGTLKNEGGKRTFNVLFFEDTEDKARALHHRLVFGEDD